MFTVCNYWDTNKLESTKVTAQAGGIFACVHTYSKSSNHRLAGASRHFRLQVPASIKSLSYFLQVRGRSSHQINSLLGLLPELPPALKEFSTEREKKSNPETQSATSRIKFSALAWAPCSEKEAIYIWNVPVDD